MTTSLQQHEIPAVFGRQTQRNRLVVVPDISSFWVNSTVDWTYQGIRDIMRWCNFDPDGNGFNDASLVVASPWITAPQYRNKQYKDAWDKWCRQYSNTITPVDFYVMSETGDPGPTDQFGFHDGLAACARFYPKESYVWLDMVEVWLHFFAEAAPTLSLGGLDTYYGANLTEQFIRGVVSTTKTSEEPGGRVIEEVVLITGHAGDHEVRAFRIPKLEDLI